MKAILLYKFGGADELVYTDVPTPEINADDVLIKVYATSVNPVDWKVRQGKTQLKPVFPIILGWDVSGVIEQVGNEVTDYKVGDEVYARPKITRNGTYAEYVAVQAAEIYFKPKTVDHINAAGIPLAGLTAWQGLFDHGKLQAGQKILIQGAAGGVGTLAVQLARWKGAYVIGTASEKNIAFLKELGADEVIDYNKEDFETKLQDIDLVFDTIGGDVQRRSIGVLKRGGILVSIVGIQHPELLEEKGIHGVKYMAQSVPNDLKQLAELVDAGRLKTIIAKVMPLKDAAEAQKIGEEGHTRGKIILKVVD